MVQVWVWGVECGLESLHLAELVRSVHVFAHSARGDFFWALRLLVPQWPLAWRLVTALAIEVSWELLENSPWIIERYRQQTASLDYSGDSILNSLSDVTAAVAGFALASRLSWKAAIVVFVALELWALVIARDNLTLNVLMLLWPIEVIKDWQTSSGW